MKVNVDIFCSSATVKSEKAVTLQMDLSAAANITMSGLRVYPSISSVAINNVVKKYDTVPMYYHDYTQILTMLVKNAVTDVNIKYDRGLDVSSYLPKEASYFKNISVSPFVHDKWIYAGFDVVEDLEKAVEIV